MKKRVLIVGLGIAGMASAVALQQQGFDVVIIERAKQRRTGGYFLGIQNIGQQAAQSLGIWDNIHTRTPHTSSNWEVLEDGSRMRIVGFADALTRPAAVLRGDVEAGLWQSLQQLENIEIRFDCTPMALHNEYDGVRCELQQNEQLSTEYFDLVIGADGMRSTVRQLAFGLHEHFIQPLNAMICAFQMKDKMDEFKLKDGVILSELQRSLFVFPLEDHTPTALFSYECQDIDAQFQRPAVDSLKDAFAGMHNHDIVDKVLSELAQSDDYLFDSVNMVKMPKWVNGRIMVLGDAAWCLTLYSGMGATMGIVGAYELGQAIATHDNLDDALRAWEKKLRPMVRKHQWLVKIKRHVFLPHSRPVAIIRRVGLRVAGLFLYERKQKKHKQLTQA